MHNVRELKLLLGLFLPSLLAFCASSCSLWYHWLGCGCVRKSCSPSSPPPPLSPSSLAKPSHVLLGQYDHSLLLTGAPSSTLHTFTTLTLHIIITANHNDIIYLKTASVLKIGHTSPITTYCCLLHPLPPCSLRLHPLSTDSAHQDPPLLFLHPEWNPPLVTLLLRDTGH